MLRDPSPQQLEIEMVTLESLVPQDHLLRKIDQFISFEFIRDKVRDLYCPDNGRPAVDPVTLFKMLFIGYLFGIPSERRLVQEIQVNVAYRWFLRLRLTDKVIDASTFSQTRRRRFAESTIYQDIFDDIVRQAVSYRMVGGRVLYTDSTHLKASANKKKWREAQVTASARAYMDELEQAVEQDRLRHNKKPLPEKTRRPDDEDNDSGTPEQEAATRTIKQSTTDPDSGYMVREGKPEGFFYLDHRTVDAKYAIITDSHVTPGNVNDSTPYLARLDRQVETFGFEVEAVGLDAGYNNAPLCHGLVKRGLVDSVLGYCRPPRHAGYLPKRAYVYDEEQDVYRCPQGEVLQYQTTNREGYRIYVSNPTVCAGCERRMECTRSRNKQKQVTRHVWQDDRERLDRNRLSEVGRRLYKGRQETVERSFADAKQHHGHRYARYRGLSKVQMQSLLAAACQNMKKIALVQSRKRGKDGDPAPDGLFNAVRRYVSRLWRDYLPNGTVRAGMISVAV